MRENVADLAHGPDVTVERRCDIENRPARRLDRIVAPVARPLKCRCTIANEGSRYDPADSKRIDQPTHDRTDTVKALEPEDLLMGGNLEHAVCRRVADRRAGSHVLLSQLGDDFRAGCVLAPE